MADAHRLDRPLPDVVYEGLVSGDEQLQRQKDKLWEIHAQKRLIACLQDKLHAHWKATDKIRKAWDGEHLGAIGGGPRGAQRYIATLPPDEFARAVGDLEEAKQELEQLESSFNLMLGARQ